MLILSENVEIFEIFLMPSLARSVPKSLKVPIFAFFVHKPLSIFVVSAFGGSWRAPDGSPPSLSTPYQQVVNDDDEMMMK